MDPEVSKRHRVIVSISASCANLIFGLCYSLQTPFYPAEAEKKKVSATEYGLIIGCYEFVCFLTSPICGKLVQKTGCKLMLSLGLIFNCIILAIYGTLDLIDNKHLFIFASFALRASEAFCATAAIVASASMCCCTFPNNVATALASFSVFISLGFVIGPAIGGILFQIGGFPLPFVAVGTVTGIVSVIISCLMPSISNKIDKSKPKIKLITVLKKPSMSVIVAASVIFPMSQLFYCTILEPHLRSKGVSQLMTSFIFTLSALTFLVLSPFIGKIVDKGANIKHVLIAACCFHILGNSLIGPWPFIPEPKTLILFFLGIFLIQLAGCAGYIGCSVGIVKTGIKIGLPADISTYGMTSSIWNSALSLGSFIGPSVAGFLYQYCKFKRAILFVGVTNAILLTVLVCYLLVHKSTADEEKMVKDDGNTKYQIVSSKTSDGKENDGRSVEAESQKLRSSED